MQVCDAAEFCRNVHFQQQWREAAQDTAMQMHAIIHDLNAGSTIYSACRSILDQPQVCVCV